MKTGLDVTGVVQFQGLHLDRVLSLDEANTFVEDAITAYGEGAVECVIVLLQGGRDSYGTRRVMRRVNNARAWWE